MADKIRLEIVTPNARLTSEDVDEVTATGALGEFGVFPEHCQLLTTLAIGPMSYKAGGAIKRLALSGGYAEVGPERMTILAETAEFSSDIDLKRAQAAKEKAGERLKSLSIEDKEYKLAEDALARAEVRISVASDQ